MNKINFKFKSITKNISLARNMISLIIVDKNPTISFVNELKTIISEGVTNAIIHGYNNDSKQEVMIDVIDTNEYIEITIKDNGIGIKDLEEAQIPMFTTKEEDDRSGLGFTIMKMFADEFSVTSMVNEGTEIKIRKNYI